MRPSCTSWACGVDPGDAAFEAILAGQRAGRRDRLEETLTRLDELGLPVRDRLPEVPGGIDALGRPHVARALVAAGHAESVDDAFRRYLEPGQAAYVRRSGIGPRAAIEAITAAGGLPSLAHSRWAPAEPDVIDRLRDWGLCAIEVYYPGWDEPTVEAMAAFAAGARPAGHRRLRLPRRPGRLCSLAGHRPRATPRRRAHRRSAGPGMSARATLPVLDMPAPPSTAPRPGVRPHDALEEYATEDRLLPAFHVWTLGCQMNASDSEEMAGALLAAGCREAGGLEEAGLIVINTCSIRETAEQKVIGRMGVLARRKAADPTLRVVLTGCSVRADNAASLRRRYPAVDLFLRPDEEPELVERLGLAGPTTPGALSGPGYRRVGRSVAAVADRLPATRAAAVEAGRIARSASARAWLPIVYGCDKTCTYCIVPFSRGPERSRPFDDIVAEARTLAASGCREITLLGQNVNSWGHDLPPDPRFAEVSGQRRLGRAQARDGRPDIAALLRAIDGIRDGQGRPVIDRLRFVTSHPWDLTERLISAMADCPSVCEHLHLPVQSGSDEVLQRMGRQYGVAAYGDLVARLRAAVPGISLTTDVIVGFCGETEEQFEATLELLRRVRFEQVFAAAYSPRPGTPAARLADDVPAAEKRRRLNALLAVQEVIGLESNQAWLGRRTEVLVEEARPPRHHDHDHHEPDADADAGRDTAERGLRLVGRNREHKLVHFDGPADLVGQLVDVDVTRAGPYALAGRAVGEGGHALSCRPWSWSVAPPRRARQPSPSRSRDACPAPRSCRPIRARSTAAWTSARPRRRQPSARRSPPRPGPRGPGRALHGRGLPARGARRARRHRGPGRAGVPRRRHGPLPAGRGARPAAGRGHDGRRGPRRARAPPVRVMASRR